MVEMGDSRPIGFFDSGLGGLTVLKAVRSAFPKENYIYLGDTARLPYGTKSPVTIRKYTEQNIAALKALDVKAIVVACNTASTTLIDPKTPLVSTIPIYNVIEPGADAAIKASTGLRIGILGTRATITSKAYEVTLLNREPKAVVFSQAAPLLVPLVEEGWELDPITNLIIYRYVAPLLKQSIDTLILGCTHYPILRESISKATGASVELVDSGHAIASILRRDFTSGRLKPTATETLGGLKLLATDTSNSMNESAQRLLEGPATFESIDL